MACGSFAQVKLFGSLAQATSKSHKLLMTGDIMLRLNAAGIATLLLATTAFAQEAEAPPKLVLQITVDQLRGDMIDRFRAGLGDGGFNRLLQSGVHFANAHHRHANTETIVGHTTLSTGTDPGIHGMVANLWFDRDTGTTFYNVQDPDYPLVGASGVDADTEIDPTQRAATTDGRSPRNILTSTIGDEIRMHYGPDTKVFGVSVKDRGAISFAGHSGQAYWFSKSEGRFVTSTFYREDYPAWMSDWELQGFVNSYAGSVWTPMLPAENYLFWDKDDQPWETDFPGFGRTFPHAYPMDDDRYYTTLLTLSPAGDEITVDFAKALAISLARPALKQRTISNDLTRRWRTFLTLLTTAWALTKRWLCYRPITVRPRRRATSTAWASKLRVSNWKKLPGQPGLQG